ncbi:AP-1-like transcription factor, partial [Lecanoromycetidae sp. Uapishka_2]
MDGTAFGPDLSLSPDQEGLLRTALSSNKPHSSSRITTGATSDSDPVYKNPAMANATNMFTSPTQQAPSSGQLSGYDDSPLLDYNLDDGDFDWDNNNGDQFFGDLPGEDYHEEAEHHDKRKASSGEEDGEEGSSKRREGGEKGAKKPGRKPLTGEPTTKRKAQNRAAQRAFRERKERHLKDLETKVEDLEKASETANHENGKLRAQVEKLNTELKEYRKRISLNNNGLSHSPPQSATPSRSYYNNGNGNDFSFAFPKFGDLPGSFLNNGSIAKTTSPPSLSQRSSSTPNTSLPAAARKSSSNSGNSKSPISLNGTAGSIGTGGTYQTPTTTFNSNDFSDLNGLFSPSILQNASRSNSADYISYPSSTAPSTNGAAKPSGLSSINSQAHAASGRQDSSTSVNSPSSITSHGALDSSCGTTPESSAESPDIRKSSDTMLNTIKEEAKGQNNMGAASNFVKSPAADVNGFNWMAQQNDGQFDPVLFGDYRDPQDSILNDFFSDAFPLGNDFGSPYNTADYASPPPKKDLMQEIEVQKNSGPDGTPSCEEVKKMIGTEKLWPRIQASGKVQSGEIDMDNLCSELKKKARCSGSGAVIDEKDVDRILGPVDSKPATQMDDWLR